MLAKYMRGLKRGLKDPRWLSYYVQRDLAPNPILREKIANLLAHGLPSSRSFDPSIEAQNLAQRLTEDGLVSIPNLLADSKLDDILGYLRSKPCSDPRHPEMPAFYDPAEAHKSCFHAYYCDEDVVHTPHLMAIANHPLILQTIESLFGCKPTIATIYIWWLLRAYDYSDSEGDYFCWNANHLHRDVDDWAQIKLFIYLTDVDSQSAPHLYLEGSHRGGIASGKKNVPLEEVEKNSFEKLKTITGPAGTAWLENAYGLHLGTLPKGRDRLIAAIGYSILPQPFTTSPRKYQPGLDPFAYDPYINRLWVQDEDRLSGRAS
jgi:hypothetical protein